MVMAEPSQDAYCTLLTSDSYLPGALVLAHSLRDNGTKKLLVALVTLDSLNSSSLDVLKGLYDQVIPVDRIVNKSPANLYLMNRPDLSSTFTKIALWRQVQFRRIVYIDADVVALRTPDELFDLESSFAAVPDIGWPDCFNSGVLALSPNLGDHYALLALAQRGISFDGADQGLLNMHFRNWERISFVYNCTPSGSYQYVPAYRHFQSSISMVHFIGPDKPWMVGRESKAASGTYDELLGRWWAVYDRHFKALVTARTSQQEQRNIHTVQQYVKGEASTYGYGNYSILSALNYGHTESQAKEPFTRTTKALSTMKDKLPTPASGVDQPRFSAPHAEWDPVRQPPPLNARPEAANFPREIYVMSADPNLYQAPKSYPHPPKDLTYRVPEASAEGERPKPIFPWEGRQSKPTRVFAEDQTPPPLETALSTTDDDETQVEEHSPTTPTLGATSPDPPPFSAYSRTNAWDEDPQIERYVYALAHSRKAKIQALASAGDDPVSPGIESDPSPAFRRPSMRLTDFPTEIERPSLPVTPAPVQRPSFWGEERNAEGDLPAAEGVPKQEEWDPVARLEELTRKQPEVLVQGSGALDREIPDRRLPESAGLVPSAEEEIVPPTSVEGKVFRDPESAGVDFGARNAIRSGEDEGVFIATGS